MEEIWKPIEGFEDYFVSNTGRIRTRTHTYHRKNGVSVTVSARELRLGDNGLGYKKVELHKEGTKSRQYVHRLVAKAFVPKPDGKDYINHKDCNPGNNNVENLEWVTFFENLEYARKLGRCEVTDEKRRNMSDGQYRHFTPVIGTNIETGEKLYFDRMNAVKKFGFHPSNVNRCCKGKSPFHKGYTWEYEKHNPK